MKKLLALFLFPLFLFLDSSTSIYGQGQDDINSNPTSYIAGNANYFLARSVMGTGGVLGAQGPNHFHNATAGQTLVGGMHGPNHFLASGFWLPAGYIPPVSVESAQDGIMPQDFNLQQNFPNPFNPQTTIEYDLPIKCLITVEVFNAVGQRIRLVNSQNQGPGHAVFVWDGFDDHGEQMGSGVYLYRVTALTINGEDNNANVLFQRTKKMLLVK